MRIFSIRYSIYKCMCVCVLVYVYVNAYVLPPSGHAEGRQGEDEQGKAQDALLPCLCHRR